jgi:hypothetical protein
MLYEGENKKRFMVCNINFHKKKDETDSVLVYGSSGRLMHVASKENHSLESILSVFQINSKIGTWLLHTLICMS